MCVQNYYCLEVYLPDPIQNSSLVEELRNQWSNAFGGTTSFVTKGTYKSDPDETVTIIRVFVPTSINRDEVIDYFTARKNELSQRFQDQDEFLITFSDNCHFL